MNKKRRNRVLGEVEIKYMNRRLRWLIASLLGVLMVYTSEPDSWLTLHHYEGYGLAMGISCSIAIGLSEIINYGSILLDRKWSWATQLSKRIGLQFLGCFLLPLILCVFCYWFYFRWYGYEWDSTTYMDKVFTPLAILLVTCNGYYPLHFFKQLHVAKLAEEKQAMQAELEILESIAAAEEAKAKETALALQFLIESILVAAEAKEKAQPLLNLSKYNHVDDIALIISIGRVLFWYGKGATRAPWYNSLHVSTKILPHKDFFRVNKSCIVARKNISEVSAQNCKRVVLTLALPLAFEVNVSQRNISSFKQWYGNPNLRK